MDRLRAPLLAGLEGLVDGSPLFDAAFGFATGPGAPPPVGSFEPAGAATLGVEGVTLLAVRPDRHIGFRSDRADTGALRRYAELVLGDPAA